MNDKHVAIHGLVVDYPEYRYETNHLIDLLGNKLSENVKENIKQLGVEHRFFIRPIENYIGKSNNQNQINDDGEPISDLSASVAKECLSKLGLTPNDVTCLVTASENSDYQSPGLAPILVTKIGLSNFIPHYNLQGTACSTLPKLLELGKSLVNNNNDTVLFVISGCNSGWYLPHLREDTSIVNPKEIDPNHPEKQKLMDKWVSTMFSFLFGDGVCAFILKKADDSKDSIKIGKITHAVNFDKTDYRKASVRLVGNERNRIYSYQLTAAGDILPRSLDYCKKVLMKSLNKQTDDFDQQSSESFLSKQKKVMIHTGSLKILDGFKGLFNLQDSQIKESYETLNQYGNLTGVSIPTVMYKAFGKNQGITGNGVLIGITMGFGLDIVEVEKF